MPDDFDTEILTFPTGHFVGPAVPARISSLKSLKKVPMIRRAESNQTITPQLFEKVNLQQSAVAPIVVDLSLVGQGSTYTHDVMDAALQPPVPSAAAIDVYKAPLVTGKPQASSPVAPPISQPAVSLLSPEGCPPPARRSFSEPDSLSLWGIDPPRPTASTQYPHLPVPTLIGPTSFPNSVIPLHKKDLEYTVTRLLTPALFETFVSSSQGRVDFRSFLLATGGSSALASLDLWSDLRVLHEMNEKARLAAAAITDVYMKNGELKGGAALPQSVRKQVVTAVRDVVGIADLDSPAQQLLSSLYAKEFQTYIKHRLVQRATVTLGASLEALAPPVRGGLGDVFCLSNPRLLDCPIVLCSPAFCTFTGYSAQEIVGRNCRFLQGAATSPATVTTMREAIANAEGFTQLVLNYRGDGTPFWNLLCCVPIHDARGELIYFIGGQTDVTSTIAAGGSLSFLLTGDTSLSTSPRLDGLTETVVDHSKAWNGDSGEDRVHDSDDKTASSPSTLLAPPPPPLRRASKTLSRLLSSARVSSTKAPAGSSPLTAPGACPSPPTRSLSVSPTPVIPARTSSDSSTPLRAMMTDFAGTYTQVLMFRRKDREILFVSPAMLQACGLPCSTSQDLHASPLVRTDFLEAVDFESKATKKEWKARLEQAINEARAISVPCGIRTPTSGSLLSEKHSVRFGMLHITPMFDHREEFAACVAVFAERSGSSSPAV